MTRLEKLQSLSAEEMATFLRNITLSCYVGSCDGCKLNDAYECDEEGIKEFLSEECDGTW